MTQSERPSVRQEFSDYIKTPKASSAPLEVRPEPAVLELVAVPGALPVLEPLTPLTPHARNAPGQLRQRRFGKRPNQSGRFSSVAVKFADGTTMLIKSRPGAAKRSVRTWNKANPYFTVEDDHGGLVSFYFADVVDARAHPWSDTVKVGLDLIEYRRANGKLVPETASA